MFLLVSLQVFMIINEKISRNFDEYQFVQYLDDGCEVWRKYFDDGTSITCRVNSPITRNRIIQSFGEISKFEKSSSGDNILNLK